ncbi:MAG: type IX secretion system PorP/SprF family membrane protein [Candidatus Latescibacterota bacterium]|jgi:type IX secretion system PorP/SprF family membrane protein
MKLKRTYLVLFLLISSFTYAQDGIPIYSEYLADNLYIMHPSMAGAAVNNQVRLTARKQWFDQVDAPNLQTMSFNARLGEQSAVGAIVYNDKNGYHSQTGLYMTYAHHLMFSRSDADLNQLSFGISGGVTQTRLDETQFDPLIFDPIIANIIQSTSYFNVDAGFSYNFLNFSGHFTVKNLLFQNRNLFSEEFESNNQRKYVFGAAYSIGKYGSVMSYEPSIMIQFQERTGEQAFDLNFKAYREVEFGKVWAALSYRRSFDGAEFLEGSSISDQKLQYITPILGVNYKQFMFAYTYSYQVGTIKFESGGHHQITIGFDFLGGRQPAYDCNCPAIN